jgi:hypothetical protein
MQSIYGDSKAVLKDGIVLDGGQTRALTDNVVVTQVSSNYAYGLYYYFGYLIKGWYPASQRVFQNGILYPTQTIRNLVANVQATSSAPGKAFKFLPPTLANTYVYITNLFNRGSNVLFPVRIQQRSISAVSVGIAAPVQKTRSKIISATQGYASNALYGIQRYIGNFQLVGEEISNSFKGGLEYYYPTTQTGLNRSVSVSQVGAAGIRRLKSFFIFSQQTSGSTALQGITRKWNLSNQISAAFKGGTAYYIVPIIYTLFKLINVVNVGAASVQKSRTAFIKVLQTSASIALDGVTRASFNLGRYISNAFDRGSAYLPVPQPPLSLTRTAFASTIGTSRISKALNKNIIIVQTNTSYFIETINRVVKYYGHQISQALFGGETLFPSQRNLSRTAVASFTGTIFVKSSFIKLPKLISIVQISAQSTKYLRIKKVQALLTNTAFALRPPVVRIRLVNAVQVTATNAIKLVFKGKFASVIQFNNASLIRTTFRSRSYSAVQTNTARINYIRGKNISAVAINKSEFLKNFNKLVRASQTNNSRALKVFNPIKRIFVTQTNTSYFTKVHNPTRAVKLTLINSANVLKKKTSFRGANVILFNIAKPRYSRNKLIYSTILSSSKINTVRAKRIYASVNNIAKVSTTRTKNIRALLVSIAPPRYITIGKATAPATSIGISNYKVRKALLRFPLAITFLEAGDTRGLAKEVGKAVIVMSVSVLKRSQFFRFVSVTKINTATLLRIANRVRKAQATLVNSSRSITVRIRNIRVNQLNIPKVYRIQLKNIRVLNVNSSFLRRNQLKVIRVTRISIPRVTTTRNKNIKVLQTNVSRFSVIKIRRVFSAVQVNNSKVKYIRTRNVRATQVRASINTNTKQRVRYVKALLTDTSRFMRIRRYNRKATANQVVGATVTRTHQYRRDVKVTTSYAIGTNRRVNYVRKVKATAVGSITSKKFLGKHLGIQVQAIYRMAQSIITKLNIPVQTNIFRRQGITTKINIPVISRASNVQLNISDQWTTPNNGESVPGTGPVIHDEGPIDYSETNNELGFDTIPEPK